MILTERLQTIATMVDKGSVVADIGTDHAYLPVFLIQQGICGKALACDINPLPLEKGNQNIIFNHLQDKIETRLCDGLNGIGEDEADTFIMAGMGADVIIHILSSCEYIANEKYTLIIQPMTRYYTLTQWLYENGFEIKEQKCTHEGKRPYTIMKIKYIGKKTPYTESDLYLGSMDTNDEECKIFLSNEIRKLNKRVLGEKGLEEVINILEETVNDSK